MTDTPPEQDTPPEPDGPDTDAHTAAAEPEPALSDDTDGATVGTKRALVWIGVVLLGLALGAVGVLLLFSSGSEDDVMALDRPPKEGTYEHVDALVLDASDTKMRLMQRDGRRLELRIRPADRGKIDVQHAETHASLGQPVRLYYREVDGQDVIVYMEDSPEIFR